MQGQNLFPIEIKSGQTITPDYFRSLKKFRALFPDATTTPDCLVYGGEMEQLRQDTRVIRVASLAQYLEEMI